MLALEVGTRADLPGILALERESQSHPWSAAGFGSALAGEGGERAVLLCDYRRMGLLVERRLVGYCVLRVLAGELEIHNLVVAPELRRRGLGRLLLSFALAFGVRRGAERALLEVRCANAAARGLYAAEGFREVGRRPGYYAQPADDALVLGREIGVPSLP